MADTTVVAEATQRGATDTSQRDTQATQREASTEDSEPRTVSYESHQKLLNEKKGLQTKLKEYEDAQKATMTEAEKLASDRKAFDEERAAFARERRTNQALAVAQKAGAIHPDAVARLIPDDAEDIEKAVREVQKAYPALFPKGSADGGQGQNGQGQVTDMNSIIRARMGRT